MEFIPGSNELFIQQMNRPQNTNKVWIARIGSPTPQNIFTDTDAAWLDTNDNIQWLKDNTWFTWESERNGWRHLYRISRDGKEIQPVTKGDFDYISPVGTDLQKGLVYFIASPENYTQRYLYSAELFGKGEVKRLSPAGQPGQHRYNMSPTGKWAVHTYSNAATPSMIDMVSFPKHQSVRMIEDNAKAREQYAALGLNPKEFVKVTSGNLELDAWMIKPVNFDPTKKYPVIIEVYGEPASSTVQDVWGGGDLWNQYVANLGYIVVSIDNRGANTRAAANGVNASMARSARSHPKTRHEASKIWHAVTRLSTRTVSALPDGAAAEARHSTLCSVIRTSSIRVSPSLSLPTNAPTTRFIRNGT